MRPYDYARREGVHEMSWEEFADLCDRLAELLEPHRPQVVVGTARAGLFPATAVALSLRLELFPVRVSRRVNDVVVHADPVWRVPMSEEVAGKRVAIVDEMADTGTTLRMLAEEAEQLGATEVVTAALVSHSWADPPPRLSALMTDAFVVFPWDRQVLVSGEWQPHPEIVAGLEAVAEAGAESMDEGEA